MTARPSVNTAKSADRYHGPGERIVEFRFPDGTGGLISFRTMADGTNRIDVYRADANLDVTHTQEIRR